MENPGEEVEDLATSYTLELILELPDPPVEARPNTERVIGGVR